MREGGLCRAYQTVALGARLRWGGASCHPRVLAAQPCPLSRLNRTFQPAEPLHTSAQPVHFSAPPFRSSPYTCPLSRLSFPDSTHPPSSSTWEAARLNLSTSKVTLFTFQLNLFPFHFNLSTSQLNLFTFQAQLVMYQLLHFSAQPVPFPPEPEPQPEPVKHYTVTWRPLRVPLLAMSSTTQRVPPCFVTPWFTA